ncbi:lipase 1-like [Bombyx mandarina]|uniref:Lipase n=1 Tax=Bombyx mandarina TaxID=7092 RepID=A0A6J2JSK7_BOMMA|nr:lipase 1-like [Bombyx mandarina]
MSERKMLSFFRICLVLAIISAVTSQTVRNITATLTKVPVEGLMNFTELVQKYGYEVEEHDVITSDGYILKLFNIPGDKTRPVLLLPGIFGTADDYVIRGNTSLAIILAASGYDVWAINVRGTRYTRKHMTLNPDDDFAFWDYSIHEFGYYDLSANIDYVLNATGQSKVNIVGFSQGTTMTLILGATRPEYNEKVNVFIALAPVCHLQNTRGPIASLITFGNVIDKAVMPFDLYEISGYSSLTKGIMNMLCTQLPISYELCMGAVLAPLIGTKSDEMDPDFFPIIMAHFPSGTSWKNLVHFAQIGSRRSFSNYDYGTTKNLYKYKAFTPPNYDLRKVTFDTILVSGKNDRISTLKDMELLKQNLVNVKDHMILEPDYFNHLDHLWGRNSYAISYPYVLETLKRYNSH